MNILALSLTLFVFSSRALNCSVNQKNDCGFFGITKDQVSCSSWSFSHFSVSRKAVVGKKTLGILIASSRVVSSGIVCLRLFFLHAGASCQLNFTYPSAPFTEQQISLMLRWYLRNINIGGKGGILASPDTAVWNESTDWIFFTSLLINCELPQSNLNLMSLGPWRRQLLLPLGARWCTDDARLARHCQRTQHKHYVWTCKDLVHWVIELYLFLHLFLTLVPLSNPMCNLWLICKVREINLVSMSALSPKYRCILSLSSQALREIYRMAIFLLVDGAVLKQMACIDRWALFSPLAPALRAVALIKYARSLLDLKKNDTALRHSHRGQSKSVRDANQAYVKEFLWTDDQRRYNGGAIKYDLDWVADNYNAPGCDLWEEIQYVDLIFRFVSASDLILRSNDFFWNKFNFFHALLEGNQFATKMGTPDPAKALIFPNLIFILIWQVMPIRQNAIGMQRWPWSLLWPLTTTACSSSKLPRDWRFEIELNDIRSSCESLERF